MRLVTFFATAAQVLPALLIAFILESRGAFAVVQKRANWVPFGGRLYSWFFLLFFIGEAIALLMLAVGDYGGPVSSGWRTAALWIVGFALVMFSWFVLQFAWLVSIDRMFPDQTPAANEPAEVDN